MTSKLWAQALLALAVSYPLWVPQGRIEVDTLPFFAECLDGAAPPRPVARAGGAR